MALTWQEIQEDVRGRIQRREWAPGAAIPNEADLARELGCARSTVNRALQALAEDGWLERRRRAGTRVARAPQRRATVAIPLIRQQIASMGKSASHMILNRGAARLPPDIAAGLALPVSAPAERVRSLYLADGQPFAFEDRWVHLAEAPGFETTDLTDIDPNEWLVQNAAFAEGTLAYSAQAAAGRVAAALGCADGTPLLVLERRTFSPSAAVTHVTLYHAPGHRLTLSI